MTARDTASDTASETASDTDPTDAVVTDPAVPETDDATEVDAAGTAGAATGTDPDPSATTTADSDDSDDEVGTARRRGRRRRRDAAADDAATTTAADAHGTDDADDDATPTRRGASRRTRWVVTALLLVSVLFAGAMVGLYVVNRPKPIAGLSSSQQAAVDAATQAAINLQTFRRASFDQDFANALASLTPEFAQQQLAPRKDALKTQLTQGGRDASATALSAGIVSSTSTEAVVLVVTNTTQTADDGTSTPFVFSRLQLTLERQNGTWLVSDLKSVGLS